MPEKLRGWPLAGGLVVVGLAVVLLWPALSGYFAPDPVRLLPQLALATPAPPSLPDQPVAVTAPPSPPGRPALRTDGGFLENMLSGVQLDQSFLYAKEAQLVSLLTTTISRFLMERVLPQIQHVNATH